MQIEILMATYNGERFLEEQLDSLFAQEMPFRLLVRDDGSTDKTEKILSRYRDRITLLESTSRLGVVQNFSQLMAASTADYLFFCDQDDVWLPHKISDTLNEMEKLEEVHGKDTPLLVHTDLKVVREDLSTLHPSYFALQKLGKSHRLNRLLVQNSVTGCTVLMNRALANLAYPIPEGALMHDWWVALTAAAFGEISFLTQPTILYRQHGNNCMGVKKCTFIEKLKKLRSPSTERHAQAKAFLDRYSPQLSQEQKKLLKAYSKIPTVSYFKGRFYAIRYQFFKSGFLKKLFCFFFQKYL